MTPITTIVADFGGVLSTPLVPAFGAADAALGIPGAAVGAAMSAVSERRANHLLHDLESGALAESEFFALLAKELSDSLGRPVVLDQYADLYWAALRRNDALIARLQELRAVGYRMGLLTNNVREWEPRWRAMVPVDELFDVVIDSAWVGLRKPDPAIYLLTAERLGVAGEEIAFLDDFQVNCAAAREAGWTAIRFDHTDQTISELDALLAARGAPPGVGATDAG